MVRFSPSRVSNDRCRSRPDTMTRMPRVSDSATFSAGWRHTLQRRNSDSTSFHSLDWRSKVRGVDATVKLATAAPEGVNRSSGSAVRLPTTVMTVSPAMATSARCGRGGRALRLAPQHLGAQHGLVEPQLPVELRDRGGLARGPEHRADGPRGLVDLVGEAAASPHPRLFATSPPPSGGAGARPPRAP